MVEPLLDIRALTVEATFFPPGGEPQTKKLLDGVNLRLARGQVLGVIGESGAGKSTIGLAALGYGRSGARLTSGQVLVEGKELVGASPSELRSVRGCKVTYVSQSAAASFNPAIRLLDQVIESVLTHKTMTRKDAVCRAIDLFGKLGLPNPEKFGELYPHQVSGGQLQRAMTAMALCPKPDIVIFDEPTTALDVTTQIGVLIAIREAIQQSGVGALYISHDLALVAQVADEIMVLRDGREIERGPTRQILNGAQHEYTKALLSVESEFFPSRAAGRPILVVDEMSATYPKAKVNAVNNVSFSVSEGQTLAIVGESGSGKSSLARVITGLLKSECGSISFLGNKLDADFRRRDRNELREIQLIYQSADTAMNPRQTVRKIIERPLDLYFGMNKSARDARVKELLCQIEMGDGFADRYPAELSGGQKQRVCIARALAASPRLIICDEVISALDPLIAKGILNLLRRLQIETNVSYIFITHDLNAVRSIADEVLVMNRGRSVRQGRKEVVFQAPFDDYTELLLSSAPRLEIGWLDELLLRRGCVRNSYESQ